VSPTGWAPRIPSSGAEAEAQVVVAVGGLVPVPIRGTGVVRRVVPGTTAFDAVGAIRLFRALKGIVQV
jgi:hypothetical protein